MGNLENIAKHLNVISEFVGMRDIQTLTKESLQQRYGINQVDVMILFGGTIPAGYDVAAKAYLSGIAKHLLIVGGIGHTTDKVWESVSQKYPEMKPHQKSEADIIEAYLSKQYDIKNILKETKSTNCGNNMTNALAILKIENIPFKSVIMLQDLSMQRRMNATLLKQLEAPEDVTIINYAPYVQRLKVENNELCYEFQDLWGMWDIEHYSSLLLGEISRLRDCESGYGPNGMDYIVHVDLPQAVLESYGYLIQIKETRIANDLYK